MSGERSHLHWTVTKTKGSAACILISGNILYCQEEAIPSLHDVDAFVLEPESSQLAGGGSQVADVELRSEAAELEELRSDEGGELRSDNGRSAPTHGGESVGNTCSDFEDFTRPL